ncbi:MAG: nucleoside deaminase [Rhodospirillaceae bacterium]
MSQHDYMRMALEEARAAGQRGEVPVGAVVVNPARDEVLARAGNRVEELSDPTLHAELIAIRLATAKAGNPKLLGCDIYVTLEPCTMCAQAISLARIRRLYFGAYDPKSGGVEHGARVYDHATCHHKPEVIGGLVETEAGALLADFFRARR